MAEKERAKKTCKKAKTRGDGVDMFSKTDPSGSYTGTPKNKEERPVQDADDL